MATRKNNKKTKGAKKATMTLGDIFVTKLGALLDVEQQLVKALPKMAKHATDADLRSGIEKHLDQTKEHAARLEKAFALLEVKPPKIKCDAIRGLVADGEWVMKNVKGDEALDANIIAAAQYVEHYEIAGYDSALAWAKLLDCREVANLLAQTLQEERETSGELSELAQSRVNERALIVAVIV